MANHGQPGNLDNTCTHIGMLYAYIHDTQTLMTTVLEVRVRNTLYMHACNCAYTNTVTLAKTEREQYKCVTHPSSKAMMVQQESAASGNTAT